MSQAPFTFTAGSFGAGELEVARVVGSEWVSKPYSFDIDLVARSGDGAGVQRLLGERARLGFTGSDARQIAGVVARIETHATVDNLPRFRIRLVPALGLLKRRRTSRIFQNQSVPEIVRTVLAEHRLAQRWSVEGAYPKREYCVQYRETDLGFVTRLLAEEGIFYLVVDPPSEDTAATETVVFADGAAVYHPIAGDSKLRIRNTGALLHEEHVTSFAFAEQVRSGATLHRGFDFKRPVLDLRGEARARDQAALEVYDHDGDPEEGGIDGEGAKVALDQLRARAAIAEGESNCRRLVPGGWFELAEHSRDDLNRRYAVVRIDHQGRQLAGARSHGESDETYTNRFRCVPEHVAYRPKRPQRALQQVTETATVVGPPGEEIHVDEHGRIKVQFHWDREGKRDQRSSCWLRAMQPWAGAAWGSQFIPRVGMEVVVTFVGGDIDRPMVIGTVYNVQNPTPYPLPGRKTQSGIRTRTTPGGGGFNELRFEDAAGEEQVFLHAQRDLDEVIENDHSRTVGRDEAVSIGRSSRVEVGGDQELSVKGNEVVTIDKNLVVHITGKQIIHVDGQGAEDGGDTNDTEVESPPDDEPAEVMAPASAVEQAVEELSEKDLLGQKVAAAKLLFLRELVPAEHYARAKEWAAVAESLQDKVMDLALAAKAFFAKSSEAGARASALGSAAVPDIARAVARAEEAQELLGRGREIRETADQAITDALSPAPVPLHRLQVAVVDQLQVVWRRADGVVKRLAPGDAKAVSPGGSGSARGGGGADVKPWTKTPKGQESVLHIASGGGIIDSPDGLTLKGQGGEISIKGDVMRLSAGTIVLVAKTIEIVGGETIVQGNPIRLN